MILWINGAFGSGKTMTAFVKEIAQKSGIELSADKRSIIKKFFDRIGVLIKHIRR